MRQRETSGIARLKRMTLVGGAVLAAATGPAWAQAPPLPETAPAAAQVRDCICLHRSYDAAAAELNAKNQELDQLRAELARLDAELAQERARLDVNNPEAVARFKQLLDRRDAAFRAANGPLVGEINAVTARYTARINDYNARCTGRPLDPTLVQQIEPTLICAPDQ